ncbi:hypothetical protein F5H01DRAFT_346647 [Linnemannia elongata]|nr:hypothetical protein F5H01DRAFT_346647 [Linnemannia elongata]
MPVQQQHQLPPPILSPTSLYSFECDRTNPSRPSSSPSQSTSTHNNHHSTFPSSSSPTPTFSTSNRRSTIAKNKTECLSSSAPSSASSISTYSPFSSFEDDIGDSYINGNKEAMTPKPKRERPLSRDSSLKQQRQRWASWSNDATITKQQQQQQQQQHQESDLPPVQEERSPQQQSFLGVSTTASTTATRASTAAMTTDDNQDTPIASPASFEAVQTNTRLANPPVVPHTTTSITTTTACTATSTATGNLSSNPIVQTPTRQQKSAKDRVAEREQRRHSSEDGLASYRRSASSSPPTSCIVDNINSNKYAIPPKCRMVFHMRDEVPRPREEDKTELSEKRFYQYRPQPQPRARIHSLSSSSDQAQEEGSMLSPLTSSPAPVKKPNSGKCAKMVSFKEPEPWRDVTPPPPSQPPSSLSSSSSAETENQGDSHDTKQVRMLFTRLDIPTIMVTEPQQQQNQSTSASSTASPPTVRRPMSEPILSGGSTVLSTSSSSSPSSAHRHIEATRQKSSTPPPRSSSAADEPLSSVTSRHRRNLSMPVQSTSSSSSSNVPMRMQAGQGPMVEEPKAKSGNKLLRLWRSATQKYGNHHSHHHNHQAAGVGFLGGKGSDLEPLVSMARE